MRPLALLVAATALAACGIVGSDPGEFEATVSGDVSADLAGSAVSDVQDDGTTVVFFPKGDFRRSGIRILINPDSLARTALPLGGEAAALTFVFATSTETAVSFVADTGTLTLDRIDGDLEGAFSAVATSSGGAEVVLEGTFRAPRAVDP